MTRFRLFLIALGVAAGPGRNRRDRECRWPPMQRSVLQPGRVPKLPPHPPVFRSG